MQQKEQNGVLGVPPWSFRKQLTKRTIARTKKYNFWDPPKAQGEVTSLRKIRYGDFLVSVDCQKEAKVLLKEDSNKYRKIDRNRVAK